MEQAKEYCTRDGGDCGACPLADRGRDCRNHPLSPEPERESQAALVPLPYKNA